MHYLSKPNLAGMGMNSGNAQVLERESTDIMEYFCKTGKCAFLGLDMGHTQSKKLQKWFLLCTAN